MRIPLLIKEPDLSTLLANLSTLK